MKMDEVRAAIQNGEDVVVSIHEPTVAGRVRINQDDDAISMRLEGSSQVRQTWSFDSFMRFTDTELREEVILVIRNASQ